MDSDLIALSGYEIEAGIVSRNPNLLCYHYLHNESQDQKAAYANAHGDLDIEEHAGDNDGLDVAAGAGGDGGASNEGDDDIERPDIEKTLAEVDNHATVERSEPPPD